MCELIYISKCSTINLELQIQLESSSVYAIQRYGKVRVHAIYFKNPGKNSKNISKVYTKCQHLLLFFIMCEKKKASAVLNRLECMGVNAQLTVSVLDELVEAIPGVVVLVLGQVVVKSLVNGFDVGLYRMTDDI